MNAISLYELNSLVRQTLRDRFADPVWITAEITEIRENSSGHCYLQLADKKEEDDSLTATVRAMIWAYNYRMLRPYFETTAGRPLTKGMKVLVCVEVVFSEVYGYSLNIKDIDPTFTIGELERKKREIILRLEEEGIIGMNRELEFPALPKTIAVISSPTAAGWGDFADQLANNSYGYKFHVKLFPAVMQGDRTAESVIAALDRIYEHENLFDVVVIIRGGGSQTDLGSFDSYDLAANVAQFPLPVIAGIGHERDETIVDLVAHVRVKTPTAAAAFLIEVFRGLDMKLEELQDEFIGEVSRVVSDNDSRLRLQSQKIGHISGKYIISRLSEVEQVRGRLSGRLALLFERQAHLTDNAAVALMRGARAVIAEHSRRLGLAANTVKYSDPKQILARGFSITRFNGKAVKVAGTVKPGDVLETEISGGVIRSEVKE